MTNIFSAVEGRVGAQVIDGIYFAKMWGTGSSGTVVRVKDDQTIDIMGYGQGFVRLDDRAFDVIFGDNELRLTTYINALGQVVSIENKDGELWVKKSSFSTKDAKVKRQRGYVCGRKVNLANLLSVKWGKDLTRGLEGLERVGHHIDSDESNDEVGNIVNISDYHHRFIHLTEVEGRLLYDDYSYIIRNMTGLRVDLRREILTNISIFEEYLDTIRVTVPNRQALYYTRNRLIGSFETHDTDTLTVLHNEYFGREITALQKAYCRGYKIKQFKLLTELEVA